MRKRLRFAARQIQSPSADFSSTSHRIVHTLRFRRGRFARVLALARIIALGPAVLGASPEALATDPPTAESPNLDLDAQRTELVRRFLLATDEAIANDLVGMIENHAQGDLQAVADAVRHVCPWDTLPAGRHSFALSDGEMRLQIPVGYTPEKAVPVIVCFGGSATDADRTLDEAVTMLGDVAATHALVAVTERSCEEWHACAAGTMKAADLLTAIRRRVHVDTSRCFVLGWGRGGASAWVAGLQDSRELAGVILVNADIHEDFPAITLPGLATNLRPTRLLVMWDAGLSAGNNSLVAMDRALVRAATGASVDTVFEELPATSSERLRPIRDRAREFVAKERLDPADSFEFWIPAGSSVRVGKITAHSSLPPEPSGLQVAAMSGPNEAGRKWLEDRIAERMSHVIVRTEGPRLILDAKRCSRVDVYWAPVDIMAGAKRTVVCNGVTRFDDVPKPSIRAMLDHARRTWDFENLDAAMTEFTLRADAP